jgi:putative hemolysin
VILEILVLVVLITLSGLFSGSEIALFSLSNIKVRKLMRERRSGAKTLKKLKANPHRMLVTILIGNNVVNIGAAALATIIFTEVFGSAGIGMATGIMTFLVLVFGEITPKSFFHQNAERMSLLVAGPIYILTYVLYPVIIVVELISRGILRAGGVKRKKDQITEEEIMAALSLAAESGVIDRDEEEMMQNVIDFGESRVKEAYTPLSRMITVDSIQNLMDVLTRMLQTKYSRIPVYNRKAKKVVGVVNLRSILKYVKNRQFDLNVMEFIDPVVFVNENDMLDEAFDRLKEHSSHMAVVLDDRKRVRGIVTMEDLLEEIVGEIYDETDRKKVRVHHIDKKTAIVRGDMLVKDVQDKIGVPLKGRFATVSDLLSARFDNRPKRGKSIKLKNFTLTVLDVDGDDPSLIRRIKIVKRRGKIKR